MDPQTPIKLASETPELLPTALQAPSIMTILLIFFVTAILSSLAKRLGSAAAATKVRRWLPMVHVVIWGTAAGLVGFIYAARLPDYWIAILALFLLVMVVASAGWMRSVTAGVALAVEGRISIGDSIRLQGVEGEIVAFSLRSVRVRSVDGSRHEIPNEKFMLESVANLSGDGGDSACEITIKVPPALEPNRALTLARNAAILTPLASPQHTPEVFLNTSDETDDSFEVHIRGYAFDPSYQDHYRSDVVARFHDDFRRERAFSQDGSRTTVTGLVLTEKLTDI